MGADTIELREGDCVAHHLTRSEIDGVRVGVSARGRAGLLLHHDRGVWRLPLDTRDLTWARMLIARVVQVPFADLEATVAPAADDGSMETQERAYQERKLAQGLSVSTPKGVMFLASAIAFGTTMAFSTSWQWLAVVMPVLFIHELGHWLAMRAFGHDDAHISFIPFLGAATMTKRPFEKRWQEIVMLLAGPMPGIALAVAVLLSPLGRSGPAQGVAVVALGVNVMNLLPFHPLDGGRILHALVTAGRPRLDLAFKTVAALVFVAAGFQLHAPVIGGLGVFGLYSGARVSARATRERDPPDTGLRSPIAREATARLRVPCARGGLQPKGQRLGCHRRGPRDAARVPALTGLADRAREWPLHSPGPWRRDTDEAVGSQASHPGGLPGGDAGVPGLVRRRAGLRRRELERH